MTDAFSLPSAGPDPIAGDTALAAVLGYARGRFLAWLADSYERETGGSQPEASLA